MRLASIWFYSHWSEDYLPNNKWIAALKINRCPSIDRQYNTCNISSRPGA
jgi:hypothetical protein